MDSFMRYNSCLLLRERVSLSDVNFIYYLIETNVLYSVKYKYDIWYKYIFEKKFKFTYACIYYLFKFYAVCFLFKIKLLAVTYYYNI